ncbi:helix-turn-helix transcriptional regulator [Erythrobacter alti]|uniref:helix-turn-helix transcriptional regulator n=1 Tax=Erythrobacter alti TaxID=1896145 RepID=UPI0030F42A23
METIEENATTEAICALRDAQEFMQLRDAVDNALDLFGVKIAYFVAPITSDSRIEPVLFTVGLPEVAARHYRKRLRHADPLPTRSTRFANAFFWPDDIEPDDLTPYERRYTKIATRFGLEQGIGVACYGPQGRTGFLGVGWPETKRPSNETLLAVHQIAQVAFQRYCQMFRHPDEVVPLSGREAEVLGWMCSGKSNPAIAEIIGVSRSSVDAYIRRIFKKLEVSDRTAACLRAQSLGMVVTDELAQLTEAAKQLDRPNS